LDCSKLKPTKIQEGEFGSAYKGMLAYLNSGGLLLLAFVVIQTFLSSSVFTRSAEDRQTYGR
jgi:hypothetical protein